MGNPDHGAPRARIGPVRGPGTRSELVDLDEALPVRVVDPEAPRGPVVARERHRQQAALATGRDAVRDVEEGPPQHVAALHDPDPALPLHDEAAPVAARRRDVGRLVEAPEEEQPDGAALGGLSGRGRLLGRRGRRRLGGHRVLRVAPVAAAEREQHEDQDVPATAHAASVWQRRPRPTDARLGPVGLWRSLVARSVRVGEVAGSNPVSPISRLGPSRGRFSCDGAGIAVESAGRADYPACRGFAGAGRPLGRKSVAARARSR